MDRQTEIIVRNIETLLMEAEIAETDASVKMGLGRAHLSTLLRGGVEQPRIRTLGKIAKFFGVTVQQLRSPDMKPSNPIQRARRDAEPVQQADSMVGVARLLDQIPDDQLEVAAALIDARLRQSARDHS